MQPWVETELATSDLGDARLDERYKLVLDVLSGKPTASLPAALGGSSELRAAYRFFANEKVDSEAILAPHREATLQRIAEQEVVLLLQDTTEFDMTRPQRQQQGAGPLSDENHVGHYSHLQLAVTPDRVPMGLVGAKIWARDWDEFRANRTKSKEEKAREKKQKSIEEKESFRWLEGYRRGCEIAEQTGTQVVVISDSEGDIYECFAEAKTPEGKADWIIRAARDRALADSPEQKLWDEVAQSPALGTFEVDVRKNRTQSKSTRKRNKPRSARTATVSVHATTVTLRGPYRPGGRLENLVVNAVLVRETSKPPEGEEPIEWLLLTSLPVGTFAEAQLAIAYYRCRWEIENYIRVLKSGCNIEELQLQSASNFVPCVSLYMVIAWRVMYCLMVGREYPDLPCDVILADDEWRAVYAVRKQEPPPKEPPSIGKMVELIAQLGGYLGRKSDGPPGPTSIWIGMQRMVDLALAWRTFGPGQPAQQTCVQQ